jgi:hypothetical protein
MWEIWTQEDLYPQFAFQSALGVAVVKDKIRPPIPSNCPKSWVFLMTQCWSQSPAMQPNFQYIVQSVESWVA